MTTRRKIEPEKAARELLEAQGIRKAPIPVDKIAKALGIQIRYSPLDAELSGMIYIKEGIPIIGVNALHHPNRQRFTIAHELGHYMLHRDMLSNEVHVDKQFKILMRNSKSSAGTDAMEVDANKFAAELLLPEFLIADVLAHSTFDIDDPAPLDELAKKFKVSKQMVEYRIRG
ncbi:MAG: ImmA/IrrE family metallo-endopeptidase [Burkholderiaceae bacterium]|nr:ImmA/IrrE family metallo-endopeptidase [Burkholderiaceae bacterium]